MSEEEKDDEARRHYRVLKAREVDLQKAVGGKLVPINEAALNDCRKGIKKLEAEFPWLKFI